MTMPITEHAVRTGEHVTAYLACGPEDGPLVVFVHGWPELSSSWRHQLPVLGALGFRAIAQHLPNIKIDTDRLRYHPFVISRTLQDLPLKRIG